MEISLLVSLVVVMVFSCAMCIAYRAMWKEAEKELQDLKFVNKLKENAQIKKKPVKSEITIGKTQADFLCMISDSSRFMKNIEALLARGYIDQAEATKNLFMNIIAPKYINDRNPESFIYVADMFDALASKKIFEQRCKNSEKTVDKKD